MARTGTTTTVAAMPTCNFCDKPAEYDFRTRYGGWAYGCEEDWTIHRDSPRLGTGIAQHLVLITDATTPTWVDRQEADDPQETHRRLVHFGETIASRGILVTDIRWQWWESLVNEHIHRYTSGGAGLHDIADWRYRDAYDEGMSPQQAAEEALRADDVWAEFMNVEPEPEPERTGDPQDHLHREREKDDGPEIPDVLRGLVWKAGDRE